MAEILTPVTLWKDFDDTLPLEESVIKEYRHSDIKFKEIYFSGRKTETDRVRIFGVFAKNANAGNQPAVLILPDYNSTVDFETINYFVALGYSVLMIDYKGATNEKTDEKFTVYPEDVAYANFVISDANRRFVEKTAKETSWYEWVSVARYSLNYLKSVSDVTDIGVVGIKHGGHILWQLLGTTTGIKCGVSLFGCGWEAYRGLFKFNDAVAIEFSDERYKFVAAIDAHAYAQYVKCPVLHIGSTNDAHFDADRSYDTILRVNSKIDCVYDIAPFFDGFFANDDAININLFLKQNLLSNNAEFPKPLEFTYKILDNKLYAVIKNDEAFEDITFFYAENNINPAKRSWEGIKKSFIRSNYIYFEIELYSTTKKIFGFFRSSLNSGYTISSGIIQYVLDNNSELYIKISNKIVFSSSVNSSSVTILNPGTDIVGGFMLTNDNYLQYIEGPSDICGIYSKYGLLFYKISEDKFKTNNNFILKFDIYSDEMCKIKISFTTDYLTETENEYSAEISLTGGKIWKNFTLIQNDFKTVNGLAMRKYDRIDLLKIEGQGKYAINNVLFI